MRGLNLTPLAGFLHRGVEYVRGATRLLPGGAHAHTALSKADSGMRARTRTSRSILQRSSSERGNFAAQASTTDARIMAFTLRGAGRAGRGRKISSPGEIGAPLIAQRPDTRARAATHNCSR